MADSTPDKPTLRTGAAELSEDALGFGALELRTIRDLVLRPRRVLEAHETLGRTGGGLYAPPLRMYLLLNGVMMLILFLTGGMAEQMLSFQNPTQVAELTARSGKSMDAFTADFDNWISLAIVPVGSVMYAIPIILLVRLWTRGPWRQLLRSAFTLLNVWTIPLIPLTPLLGRAGAQEINMLAIVGLLALAFGRLGHGRWFRTPVGGVLKGLAILLAWLVFATITGQIVLAIGLLGAVFGP